MLNHRTDSNDQSNKYISMNSCLIGRVLHALELTQNLCFLLFFIIKITSNLSSNESIA